jgi:hypothetical protein
MQEFQFRRGAISATECVSEGLELIKPNYWLFFGMVVVELVILFVINFVPYIGGLLNAVMAGPLLCGIYIAMLMQARGERVDFSMMFEGFSRFLPAFLVTLIPALPWLGLPFVMISFGTSAAVIPDGGNSSPVMPAAMLSLVLFFLVAFVIAIALHILVFFALQLIADRNLGIGDAVKLSFSAASGNLGGIFLLMLLEGLMLFAGVLVFCFGFLFVLPIVYAANVAAYRHVFPDASTSYYNEPPRPEYYNDSFNRPS